MAGAPLAGAPASDGARSRRVRPAGRAPQTAIASPTSGTRLLPERSPIDICERADTDLARVGVHSEPDWALPAAPGSCPEARPVDREWSTPPTGLPARGSPEAEREPVPGAVGQLQQQLPAAAAEPLARSPQQHRVAAAVVSGHAPVGSRQGRIVGRHG